VPVAAMAFLGLASSAHAQITNGSFETGDFTGWNSPPPVGNASIESATTLFETPTNGTFEALIQTTNASTGSGNLANPATLQTAAQLDAYLGTGTTLESSPSSFTNGSAFKQTFSATAGSSLSFDSDFLTNEPAVGGNADQGLYFLLKGSTVVAAGSLGTPSAAIFPANPLDPIFNTETSYNTTNLGAADFSGAGSYTLEFVVLNGSGNTATDSGLLVDNVSLTLGATTGGGGGAGAVPLPAGVWAGLIGGVLALGVTLRMRRQTAAV